MPDPSAPPPHVARDVMAQLDASPLAGMAERFNEAEARNQSLAKPRPQLGQSDSDVLNSFDHHAPDAAQVERITEVRNACKHAAQVILAVCPHSADRSAAIRLLREAMMTANASIALEPGTPAVAARAER
jgi:hypothetical protein